MVDRFEMAIRGDLQATIDKELKAGALASYNAVNRAGKGVQREWRRKVTRAGMGDKLPRTVRADMYPRKRGDGSFRAAVEVYSKASYMEAFAQATVIRVRNAKALAIPTDKVGRGGRYNRKLTPKDFPKRFFDVVPSQDRKTARLVGRADGETYFILVSSVRMPKVFDIDVISKKWNDKIPGYLLTEWRKQAKRLGIE